MKYTSTQGDKLTFESRREVDTMQSVLQQYLEDHPSCDDYTKEKVSKAIDILEVMYLNW